MRRRALAGAIDVLCGIAVFAAWLGTVVWRAKRRDVTDRRDTMTVGHGRERLVRFARSGRGKLILRLAPVALAVGPFRTVRSPGARVTGIQAVDADTGGPVTVRSALAGAAFDAVWRQLLKRATALRDQSEGDRIDLRGSLAPGLVIPLTALLSPRGQTIRQRVTRTVVVRRR